MSVAPPAAPNGVLPGKASDHQKALPQKQPQVVLLHGLLRTADCMRKLERHIQQHTGWQTHVVGYPSRAFTIKELAERVAAEVRGLVGREEEVWAVTHSMGGIILRHMQALPDQGGVRWKGCCMLAPPNGGSCVARRFRNLHFPISTVFSRIYGKAGMDLGCELEEGRQWPLPPRPCGIIAGTRSFSVKHPVSVMTKTLRFFSGPSDGTVAVDETRLTHLDPEVEADFATVPQQHSDLMWDDQVAALVVSFLQTQRFQKQGQAG